jgi:hypothetical protein
MKSNSPIKWAHLREVYTFDKEERKLHLTRLRKEHIELTPYSMINTKLATQVFNYAALNIMKSKVKDCGQLV